MRRGTTPAIVLTVDMDITSYTVYVTLKNRSNELTLTNDAVVMEFEDGKTSIAFSLTQEQTLKFGAGTCDVQVRAIHDGTAIATDIKTMDVNRILKEGLIDE